jgi:hypothetical protein
MRGGVGVWALGGIILLLAYYQVRVYYQDDHIADDRSPVDGFSGIQGRRSYMEDTAAILHTRDLKLFGVYDGHGSDVCNFIDDNFCHVHC